MLAFHSRFPPIPRSALRILHPSPSRKADQSGLLRTFGLFSSAGFAPRGLSTTCAAKTAPPTPLDSNGTENRREGRVWASDQSAPRIRAPGQLWTLDRWTSDLRSPRNPQPALFQRTMERVRRHAQTLARIFLGLLEAVASHPALDPKRTAPMP